MTDTIGQRLHQARLERGYSLEQVERATHVRAYYLKALEEDDFSHSFSSPRTRLLTDLC